MSTSCVIAIKLFKDTYLATRCNFDGYFEGVGVDLREHFLGSAEIQELIGGGEIRAIRNGEPEYYPDGKFQPMTVNEITLGQLRNQWDCNYTHLFICDEWVSL